MDPNPGNPATATDPARVAVSNFRHLLALPLMAVLIALATLSTIIDYIGEELGQLANWVSGEQPEDLP